MLLTRGTNNYSNDLDGNTLTGGGRTNTWDSENRLSQCVYTNNGQTNTSQYTYGADGLRRRSVITTGSTTATTDCVLDSSMFVRELRYNGTTAYNYATYLVGPRGPEYRRDDVGQTVRWYVYDDLGSVLAEVDPSGNLTASRKYDVYGSVRDSAGTSTSKHKFVGSLGHPSDDESGLIYMRARYMDAQTGRFISQDRAKHGTNWFVYCSDDPVGRTDPTGQEDLAEVVISTAESMGIDGLDGLGLSQLEGEIFVQGDTMTVMVDWIQATGPGQMQKETFVEVLEEIAEGRQCSAIKWIGESAVDSPGYKMKLKIATELMEPGCFSHDNGITMLYWLLQ